MNFHKENIIKLMGLELLGLGEKIENRKIKKETQVEAFGLCRPGASYRHHFGSAYRNFRKFGN